MIIGNCTYSVRDYLRSGEMDLLDFAAYNADIGITALEYNDMFFEDFSEETLAAVRQSAENAGCDIVCLTCGGNLAADDEEANAEQVEVFKERLQNAHDLGAGAVRFNIGSTGDEERDMTVGVERVIDGFTQLLPMARDLDVKITIENHGGVSKWANPILEIILGTDPEWIGSCPDFGNFKPMEYRYIELAKVIPFAHHSHAKTHEFDEDGEDAEYSMERVIDIYKAAGVDGVLSIEFEGSIDQKEGVIKTRDLIQRYL